MNIYDIAEAAGVSIATVSRVINGKDNVSAQTRQKVEQVIAERGYTPNVFARGLGLGSIKMVGVLCSSVSDLFYAQAVAAIEGELRALGYDVILCCTGSDIEDKIKYMQLLLSKRVDAMILVGSIFQERASNDHIAKAAAQVPVIMVNGFLDIPNAYCVISDEEGAVYHLVRALVRDGRKELLYLEHPGTYSSISKLEGFLRGCADCNLNHPASRTLQVPKEAAAAKAAVLQALDDGIPFQAVVASEDLLALGAVKALGERGIRIPQEVAVVGFNNSMLCECSTPELSSIDNRLDDLCKKAVETLLDLIEGKNPPTRTVLTLDFVQRETFFHHKT